MQGIRPNFLIIGSAKCGTTTLSKILSLHPSCVMSRPKEPEFFNSDENYLKGLSWYSQCWNHREKEKMIGEATPRYTRRDLFPDTVDRIERFDRNLKFVHIARDPYERLVSFWRMWAREKITSTGKSVGICDFYQSYEKISEVIRSCMYEYQLEPYFAHFNADQFHLILTEDLRSSEAKVIEELFKFLDLECEKIGNFLGIAANQAKPQRGGVASRCKTVLRRLRGHREAPPVFVQREDLTADLRADFLSRIRDDAISHLDRLGKPRSIWNLEP